MIKVLNGLKIALAAIVAILIANLLKLEFSVSAGIVAILTIAPTKKETLKTVSERFIAFIIAIVISFIFFSLFGHNLISFFLYLVVYIVICRYRNWGSAMALNSVLISHFLSIDKITILSISNELLLFIIGAFCGVLVNLHLRANDDYMKKLFVEIDTQVIKILARMSERVSNAEIDEYNGNCFKTIRKSIRIATEKAEENSLNRINNKDNKDFEYINLIEQEVHILYSIYKNIRTLNPPKETSNCISKFLLKLSDTYLEEDMDPILLEFYELREKMRKTSLPKQRDEFEQRAKLYVVLEDIEEFLLLRKNNVV